MTDSEAFAVSSGDNKPLLLVEDDTSLAGSLADFLTERGYEVDFAFNGQSGVELARRNEYDVIVMDVSMPVMDGLSACQRLRDDHGIDTPIIFLTARDALDDKIAGYRSGGDDYLVKPFAPEELVCRVDALRNRRRLLRTKNLTFGDLSIYPGRLRAEFGGRALEICGTNLRLMMILVNAAPEVVSKAALEAELWPDQKPQSGPLRNHVYRLRRLLSDAFGDPLIKTVHGSGYRIELPD